MKAQWKGRAGRTGVRKSAGRGTERAEARQGIQRTAVGDTHGVSSELCAASLLAGTPLIVLHLTLLGSRFTAGGSLLKITLICQEKSTLAWGKIAVD